MKNSFLDGSYRTLNQPTEQVIAMSFNENESALMHIIDAFTSGEIAAPDFEKNTPLHGESTEID